MTQEITATPPKKEDIVVRSISQSMRESYLAYAMQVIRSRALPDIRDGLKPVHRRILYAMYESHFHFDKPHRKCARAVGDIMGKYHPHGDSSIYEALVILGQTWSTNSPLIDPQGNFGSVDGDSPAAMRYTETRLSQIAMTFFDDIEKETVAWIENYDETEKEPAVLPVPYPNLVVNGSAGIAVGIAVNLPPHNFGETLQAARALIESPDMPTEELVKIIKGPDMPTGGIVHGLDGFVSALESGTGRIFNRAKYTIEKRGNNTEAIVITEIPYRIKKAQILIQIRDLVNNKEIEGIVDLADESNKKGMRIWIAVKRDESAEAIMAQLFKKTSLEVSFNYNCTVIENEEPVKKGLRHLILAWIEFRREVVSKRTIFERKKCLAKQHVLEGYLKAINQIDHVIALIRKASDSQTAKAELIEFLTITEIQAQEILNLRLSRLTGLEIEQIQKDLEEITAHIKNLTEIIENPEKIDTIIKDELTTLEKKFGRERQSEIAHGLSTITHEDMIPREDVVIMMTERGYVKRLPTSSIQPQNRGTRGKSGITVAEDDRITFLKECHSHDLIMAITESGQTLGIKAYEIPETQTTSRGRHIRNIIEGIDEDVKAVLKIPEPSEDESDEESKDKGPLYTLISVSRLGQVRRTPLSEFTGITRKNGIKGLKFAEGDSYAACFVAHRDDDIILTSSNGKTIRFPIATINPQSRLGTGVAGIKIDEGDNVVGASIIPFGNNEGKSIIIVAENGIGKRTSADEFENQARGGKGNYVLRPNNKKVGKLLKSTIADENEDIIFMTKKGVNNRIKISSIHTVGRTAYGGVILINLDPDDSLVDFALVSQENEAEKTENLQEG